MTKRVLLFNGERIRFIDRWPVSKESVQDMREQLNSHIPRDQFSTITTATGDFTVMEEDLPKLYNYIYKDYKGDTFTYNVKQSVDVVLLHTEDDGLTVKRSEVFGSTLIEESDTSEPESKSLRLNHAFNYTSSGYGNVFGSFVHRDAFTGADADTTTDTTKYIFTLTHDARGTDTAGAGLLVRVADEILEKDTYTIVNTTDATTGEITASKVHVDNSKVTIESADDVNVLYVTNFNTIQ